MKVYDMTDDDAVYIGTVRKQISGNKRWAWLFLLLFIVQIAVILWFINRAFHTVFEVGRKYDIPFGIIFGIVLGLIVSSIIWGAGWSFRHFFDLVAGNKKEKMLIKYFEIATGEAEGKDGSSSP